MATAATTSLPASVCIESSPSKKLFVCRPIDFPRRRFPANFPCCNSSGKANNRPAVIAPARRRGSGIPIRCSSKSAEEGEGSDSVRGVVRLGLWTIEAVYILWLFLLPYAPGDPVWAISKETINSLIGLSLNFFFILPLANAVIHFGDNLEDLLEMLMVMRLFIVYFHARVVGIHLIEAPVLHPMSEGLFNFVIAWTLMFAPLLYTDRKRHRFKGSLDVLWGFQMFLTNTFLIPYMAFRMDEDEPDQPPRETSNLGSLMINGSQTVALVGGAVCILSVLWSIVGRSDGDFGNINDRWRFLVSYLGTERLAYAFIWDIVLYTVFQPWLIGDNLQNVRKSMVGIVSNLRVVPVVGLIAYLLFFDKEQFEQA